MAIDYVKEVKDPHSPNQFPDEPGSSKIGGHATDLEEDDNARDAANKPGLYLKSKGQKKRVQKVGIGKEINDAERDLRGLE